MPAATTTTPPPSPPPNYRCLRYLQSFCDMRTQRVAREVHAFTRIPLRERQIEALYARLMDAAVGATSDADVTARVNAAQDAFEDEMRFRTPRTWRYCRRVATLAVMRATLDGKRETIKQRERRIRALCQRLFADAMGATDANDLDRRLQAGTNERFNSNEQAP